jgi:pimeloyl-ACP methyl ester carboxylesterase
MAAMEPVVFADCFGWLHTADGHRKSGSRHGVVLCNPFGYDAVCIHRGWRKLAQILAESGLLALRFDYPGTGDSAGSEHDPMRIEAWIASIAEALQWIRQEHDVERLSLVGFGLGALLAALAAERGGGLDGLVLLAPVLDGRSYLRELRLYWRKWLNTPARMHSRLAKERETGVEAFGFGLDGEDSDRLATLALPHEMQHTARRILILDSRVSGSLDALTQHYLAQGTAVTRSAFDECDRFHVESLYSRVPVDAWARVTQWLALPLDANAPAHASKEPPSSIARSPAAMPAYEPLAPTKPVLRLPLLRALEQPVTCGSSFGMFCQPTDRDVRDAQTPVILILNTGANHHIGDGRFSVSLARHLVLRGIASLRVDLAGLGDSPQGAENLADHSLYTQSTGQHAAACVDWLNEQGYRQVVAFGVCSGAYIGLHLCARHPNAIATYGVNLPLFVWSDAAPGAPPLSESVVSTRPAPSLSPWLLCLARNAWLRLKASRRRYRSIYVGSEALRHTLRITWYNLAHWLNRVCQRSAPCDDTQRLVHALIHKRSIVRLAYGPFDEGLRTAEAQLAGVTSPFHRHSHLQTVVLPHVDHSLFAREARQAVMADLERWLHDCVMQTNANELSTCKRPRVRV